MDQTIILNILSYIHLKYIKTNLAVCSGYLIATNDYYKSSSNTTLGKNLVFIWVTWSRVGGLVWQEMRFSEHSPESSVAKIEKKKSLYVLIMFV